MSDQKLTVAVLGLGIMGAGIAANIMSKGFPLIVYNRTPAKTEPFAAKGAQVADSPRRAAEAADIVLVCVGDDLASSEVWLGENGALAGAKPDAVLIECSTLTPDWIRELAGLAAERGCSLLDAPLFGSKDAAVSGKVRVVVGGHKEAFEKALPVLEAFTAQVVYLGVSGAGSTWKLLNNMMGAVSLAVASEAVIIAEKAGLDMAQVAKLLPGSAGASPVVQGKTTRILEQRYDDPDFALKWMQKDVGYVLRLAEQFSASAEQARAALKLIEVARAKGYGDSDFAAVIEALRG
ncbi:MAG: NAD(P)-dependent oxidoreductase [Anaerolineae bacterium]|nr:NAD(P)-dependent oxidoreductase [Anaerolineae bacterium]